MKGFFTGTYNELGGKIKRISTGEVLYTLSGQWDDKIYITNTKTKVQEVLFDVESTPIQPKIVQSYDDMEEFESRK